MFDAIKLLGSLADNLAAPSAPNRFGAAMQQGADRGGWQQALGQTNAQGVQGAQGGSLGSMLSSLAEMAGRAANAPRQEVQNNNPAAVGGLGALAGALMGGGRGAMGGGLMAVLGSVAYSALQNHAAASSQQSAGSALPGPSNQADAARKALLIARAMIQAAKADGTVDPQETQRILGQLGNHGHDAETNAFVAAEMQRPIDLQGLVRDVTSQQEASEVYAASLMAIEVDTQAERDYMADLAASLQLPGAVVTQIHSAMGVSV